MGPRVILGDRPSTMPEQRASAAVLHWNEQCSMNRNCHGVCGRTDEATLLPHYVQLQRKQKKSVLGCVTPKGEFTQPTTNFLATSLHLSHKKKEGILRKGCTTLEEVRLKVLKVKESERVST